MLLTVTRRRGPSGPVAADFDGDGALALAVANRFSGTVSILLGKGDGTFGTHTEYAAATSPGSYSGTMASSVSRMAAKSMLMPSCLSFATWSSRAARATGRGAARFSLFMSVGRSDS